MGDIFTLEGATTYANEGRIEEWVHLFLNDIGYNEGLSTGLKLQKRYWIGPVEMNLNSLKRCCGPEPDMQYHNPLDSWNERVNRLRDLIEQGWQMPPLLAEHQNGTLWVRDGNGRLEAMNRMGIKTCNVIIWDSENQENIDHYLTETK